MRFAPDVIVGLTPLPGLIGELPFGPV